MTITINFEGLNKILCKLGIHRWYYEEYYSDRKQRYGMFKFCLDCEMEKIA